MTLVNLARFALIGSLAVLVATDNEGLWALYLIAFALGVGETLFDTAAQSILPSVVEPDGLTRANGRLYVVELTANQFVGPPLGGVIVAASAAAALTGSAVAYLLAALALTTLVGNFRPERSGPTTRIRTDIVEGVRYLARHRVLRTMALATGLSNLASTAAFSVLPLYAVDPGPMGLSKAGFGILLTTTAIGSVAAAPLVAPLEARLGRTGSLLLAAAVFPLSSLVPALTADRWAVGASFVTIGLSSVVWNVTTVSLRQRIAPDHLLGRVNAGYRLLAWGTMPLGAALGGVLGEALGLRGVFWVSAGLALACVPLLLSGVSDAAIRAAETDAEREASPAPA
jgi:MFS family permease